jgi:hypothetical protein
MSLMPIGVRHLIAKAYTSTLWFYVDVLSFIPFDTFVELALGQSQNTALVQLVKVARLLRLMKLLRLVRLVRFLNMLEDYTAISPAMFR